MNPIKVCFVFASGGIGGAERSMARLMAHAHPHTLDCSLVLAGPENPKLVALLKPVSVPVRNVGKFAVSDLTRVFRELKPDVVYLFGHVRTLWWSWAARRAGVAAIIGSERSSGTRWLSKWGRRVDRFLIDACISNSSKAAEVVVRTTGFHPDHMHVIHNGIEFNPDPIPGIDHEPGSPSIACIANLRALKGHLFLLKVIRDFQKTYPNAKAVLVGKDISNGEIFKTIQKMGLEGTYTWTGYLSDVRGVLATSDLFVLPSLVREGMPTSILEAMHAGTPVVCSRIGGVEEIVEDGVNGLSFSPGDHRALLQALMRMTEDQALRDSVVEAGRRTVSERFTMDQMIQRHVEVFGKVLADKQKARA